MKLSEEEKETSVSYWSDVETSVSDVSSITRHGENVRMCAYVCVSTYVLMCLYIRADIRFSLGKLCCSYIVSVCLGGVSSPVMY